MRRAATEGDHGCEQENKHTHIHSHSFTHTQIQNWNTSVHSTSAILVMEVMALHSQNPHTSVHCTSLLPAGWSWR
jgi:hypothetical protein